MFLTSGADQQRRIFAEGRLLVEWGSGQAVDGVEDQLGIDKVVEVKRDVKSGNWNPHIFLQGNRCKEWDQRNVFPTGLHCRKWPWTSKNRYFKVLILKVDQSGVSAPLRNLAQEFQSREPEENGEHRFVLPAERNFGNVLLFNHNKEKRRWRRKGEQGTPWWGKQLRFGEGFVPRTPIL